MLFCVCTFLFKQLFHLLYSNASYNNVHKKSLWSLQEAFTTKYDMGRNPFLKSFETLNGSLWCVLCAFFVFVLFSLKKKKKRKKEKKEKKWLVISTPGFLYISFSIFTQHQQTQSWLTFTMGQQSLFSANSPLELKVWMCKAWHLLSSCNSPV